MPSIDLQFSRGSDLSSAAIEFYDHGAWSHVDAILPDGSLLGARIDIIGGLAAGVQIRPPNYTKFEATQKVSIPCTDEIHKAHIGFLLDQVGKPYDSTAIVAFVLDRNWREDDSWFCSELQAASGEKSGWIPHPLVTKTNKLTPNALLLVSSVLTDIQFV